MFLSSLPSGFEVQQRFDLLARDALDNNTLCSTVMAAEDSNSRLGSFQKIGKEFAEGVIGAIFECGRTKANF